MEKVCGTGGGCCISATTLLAARRSWLHARLQVANRACCSQQTPCTRSGWRKPAVVSESRLQKRNRDSPVTPTGRFNETPLQVRYRATAG